jgi:hypothetical protein
LCGAQIPGSAGYNSTEVSLKNRGCSHSLCNRVESVVNLRGTFGKPDTPYLSRRRAHSESDEAWSDRMQEVGRIRCEVVGITRNVACRL